MILWLLLQQCLKRDPSVPGSVWLSELQGVHVQNRQDKQQGEGGGNGTREVGPARRGEARQQELGAKRNEAKMKSHEQEREMSFGENSNEWLNMASKNCKILWHLSPLLLQLFCLFLPLPGFFLPFSFQGRGWWEWGRIWWEEHGKSTHRDTKCISLQISWSSHWREEDVSLGPWIPFSALLTTFYCCLGLPSSLSKVLEINPGKGTGSCGFLWLICPPERKLPSKEEEKENKQQNYQSA